MELLNRKYHIEIEVLSPLAIGAGAEKDIVMGVDAIYDEKLKKLYCLNTQKLLQSGFKPDELSKFYLTKDSKYLLSKIVNNIEKVSDRVFDLDFSSDNNVKSFIRNELSGNPIIPGSSLKGAIRSVLYKYLGGKTKIGDDVFGKADRGDEFMRFIKLSDAEFDNTEIVNTKIFNLYKDVDNSNWKGGWKHGGKETNGKFKNNGINSLYEILSENSTSIGNISISEKAFNNISSHIKLNLKERIVKSNGIFELFTIINEHTQEYIKKEIAFFEKYSNSETVNIIKNLNSILKVINNSSDSCVLKMSAGAGFHSITGDWQHDDYSVGGFSYDLKSYINYGKKTAKSRKIAITQNGFELMGFVKLRILTEQEMKSHFEEREKIIIQQQKIENDRILAEEARREEERNRMVEAIAKKESYARLIESARISIESKSYYDAKKIIQEASLLLPEGKLHENLVNEINDAIQRMEAENQAKIFAEKVESERINTWIVPLEEKLKNAGNIKVIIENTKKWMKYNDKTELLESDRMIVFNKIHKKCNELNSKEKSKLNDIKRWSDLVELIGEEETKKILTQLF